VSRIEPNWVLQDGNNLLFAFPDGAMQRYRVVHGNLEFQARVGARWRQLTPDQIIQHLMLGTVVGDWLRDRIAWEVRRPLQHVA
jgi:hypothetical protein